MVPRDSEMDETGMQTDDIVLEEQECQTDPIDFN